MTELTARGTLLDDSLTESVRYHIFADQQRPVARCCAVFRRRWNEPIHLRRGIGYEVGLCAKRGAGLGSTLEQV